MKNLLPFSGALASPDREPSRLATRDAADTLLKFSALPESLLRNSSSKLLPSAVNFPMLDGANLKQHRPIQAEVLSTHTAALFQAAVARAVELLQAGEVVALPTETVYGLAANALNPQALAKIYEVKGRPAHNPIIVHVASYEMAKACASTWPEAAEQLARSFWPGPLTLVLPRASAIPDLVTAGGSTVGVRWPSHPFIQAVIKQCGFPLAAPSANLSNQISPTNAEHVLRGLGDKIPLIVDGGQSQVGIESTVVDVSATPWRMLRPGMIHVESLQSATKCGMRNAEGGVGKRDRETDALRSPGQLPKHYSPKAKLEILSWRDSADLLRQIKNQKTTIEKIHIIAHTVIPTDAGFGRVSVIPHDAEAYARALYAELHACDAAGAERILVEALPQTIEWEAIADRLKRAAA